jgi:hypothetical protein
MTRRRGGRRPTASSPRAAAGSPELGPKPLLAKLRQQQPDLAAGNKEVREALAALKAEESKPTKAAAADCPLPRHRPPPWHRPLLRRRAMFLRTQPRLLRLRPAAVRDGRRP